MGKALLSVGASELDAGGSDFKRVLPSAWLVASFEESDANPIGDGSVDLRLSKSGTDVVVHGRAKAEIEVPCARCLTTVRVALEPEISVLMVPAAKLRKRETAEREITASEADVLPYSGDDIILDDLVRDDLLLEIPMIPLCSESCAGIASPQASRQEEVARPIDPRLAPLLALSSQVPQPPAAMVKKKE